MSVLKSGSGPASAAEAAADSLARWLLDTEPSDMLVVEQCDLEKDWAYAPTGHKTFDEERERSSGLSTGNVSSNVQTSFFIRPHSMTSVNGFRFERGEVRAKDLGVLRSLRTENAAAALATPLAWLDQPSLRDTTCIIYCLHSHTQERDWLGYKKKVIHGWVLTDDHHRLLHQAPLLHNPKSYAILEHGLKAFTNERLNAVELLRIEGRAVQHVSDEVVELLPTLARRLFDEFHGPSAQETTHVERGG